MAKITGSLGFRVDCLLQQSEQILRGAGLSIVQIMYAESDMQHILGIFNSRSISFQLTFRLVLLLY